MSAVGTAAPATTTPPDRAVTPMRRLVVIGIAGGVLSGLLGVGGGVLMVPALVLWAKLDQRTAHAMSLAAIVPIGIAGMLTYGVAGEIALPETLALLAGSLVGARLGAGALTRIDERLLKGLFGGFLVAVAISMAAR